MSEEDDDPCEEQVVVAALPGETPEVHVATLDRAAPALTLRAASVRAGGDLSLGAEKTVSLASAGSVDVSDGVVAIIGRDGNLMAQLHLETPEDLKDWADGLRAVVGGGSAEPQEEDTDEDVVLLQARSRQLQNNIGELEAMGKRQDCQLQKMVRRLDGAMQMLTAVQEMCGQQRRVIAAQKDAIKELEHECGEEDDANADEAQAADAGPAAGVEADQEEDEDEEDDDEDEDEEDGEGKAEEMLRLLQQADQMTRTLQALQSEAGAAAPAPPEPPVPPEPAEADGRGGGEDDEAVLARLMRLQAEKQRFEGMLADSQQEHEDLLERLTSMRTMMRDLGMAEEGAGGSEDDEDESLGAH